MGILRRGAVGNQTRLVRGHALTSCVHANLLQFLVGEKRLDFVARFLAVPNSRFVRDAADFIYGHPQQEGGPCLRNKLRHFLTVLHVRSPHAGINAMPSSSTPKIMVL